MQSLQHLDLALANESERHKKIRRVEALGVCTKPSKARPNAADSALASDRAVDKLVDNRSRSTAC